MAEGLTGSSLRTPSRKLGTESGRMYREARKLKRMGFEKASEQVALDASQQKLKEPRGFMSADSAIAAGPAQARAERQQAAIAAGATPPDTRQGLFADMAAASRAGITGDTGKQTLAGFRSRASQLGVSTEDFDRTATNKLGINLAQYRPTTETTPSPTGTTPSPTGTTPSPTGTTPSPTGTTPSPTGTTPSPTGTTPSPTGGKPKPSVGAGGPVTTPSKPSSISTLPKPKFAPLTPGEDPATAARTLEYLAQNPDEKQTREGEEAFIQASKTLNRPVSLIGGQLASNVLSSMRGTFPSEDDLNTRKLLKQAAALKRFGQLMKEGRDSKRDAAAKAYGIL